MKILIRFFLLLVLGLTATFAGTAKKKSGTVGTHNYIRYDKWDFDTSGVFTQTGAAAGTNTDTLQLYEDSASSRPFYTPSLKMYNVQSTLPDVLPDSIKFCVMAADDGVDAVTLRVEYQVKFNSRWPWTTIGGNTDVALGGAGVKVWTCAKREFVPDVAHRLIIHPSTTTDTARVFNAYIVAPRK